MITFYGTSGPWGCLSNFSRHPVVLRDQHWLTSEHAYQALKFLPCASKVARDIRVASSPKEAAALGRSAEGINPSWDMALVQIEVPTLNPDDGLARRHKVEPAVFRVKDAVMLPVIIAKAQQNEDVLDVLKSTGGQPVVEASSKDGYWGWGPLREGQNKLGRLWMVARKLLI